MNFSAFGGPFSGIHQFAAKFGHDSQNGPFASSSSSTMNTQEVHANRYHANGNHFNQNSTSSKTIVQTFWIKIMCFVRDVGSKLSDRGE